MTLTPKDMPEESKFLLEVDFARLRTGDIIGQHYWVHAVKAAVMAGRRKAFLSRRRRAASSGRRRTLEQPPIPYGVADDTTTSIKGTARKRSHGGSGSTDDASNKLRRPD